MMAENDGFENVIPLKPLAISVFIYNFTPPISISYCHDTVEMNINKEEDIDLKKKKHPLKNIFPLSKIHYGVGFL